ncbi:alpha-glucuronidase family glycosyl hydrolase [Paenibacillus sp. CF384]|uniref:alpha-glucuronidase family glycosyl hydrolase n=1 Tax=Paenibacillus sp. CF384 TaxID=1884382 RepID=UPI00089C9D27|nr:alpha-glucuronidase family glycosyl hydrolase [Paenibacillus sp. CF384]SDX98431.1 alpha-glucuronidase [Paenibacillus sp. CF384]
MNRRRIESGYACWLDYQFIRNEALRCEYKKRCSQLVVVGDSPLLQAARRELKHALSVMLGETPTEVEDDAVAEELSLPVIVVGTIGSCELLNTLASIYNFNELGEEGYVIHASGSDENRIYLSADADKGVLYAVFHLIRLLQTGASIDMLAIRELPSNGLRMINHWDNMDGSIERGYAGRSIFFHEGRFIGDQERVRDYARLLASGGINALTINNVNVHSQESRLITDEFLPDVAKTADIFREYGIRLYLSVNYASPMELGGLHTADPLAPEVAQWWHGAAKNIYRHIPDFGGFLVKADSEFRPGPFTYGRNHADGANMLADALAPFGGEVIWRCFVYNCLQNWRDRSTDRARAAYDHFMPLDGTFRDNVMLQIKNGPMDFQVREPVSPLFGGLQDTNQLLELQITQEYTGQQRHVCFLVPQWKEVMDFDTHARGEGSTVAEVASGRLFGRARGGVAAVANIGDDASWTGHILAQANLYGYARLAWNPKLSSEQIAREWIAMTFGLDSEVERVLLGMLMSSYSIYEDYTAPLGVGWMVNPNHHYGPNVDGYEYSKWGTYHYADCHGIGVDRTARSGTGYAGQYHSPVAERYESVALCPDELLLFFHHVPYTHRLKSGKTVIQHIYDTHFEGAARAAQLVEQWNLLASLVGSERHEQVMDRLTHQAEHAEEWRDCINTYFYRKSGIADERGRLIY